MTDEQEFNEIRNSLILCYPRWKEILQDNEAVEKILSYLLEKWPDSDDKWH